MLETNKDYELRKVAKLYRHLYQWGVGVGGEGNKFVPSKKCEVLM